MSVPTATFPQNMGSEEAPFGGTVILQDSAELQVIDSENSQVVMERPIPGEIGHETNTTITISDLPSSGSYPIEFRFSAQDEQEFVVTVERTR